jgi:cytoskeletal protein RodZ
MPQLRIKILPNDLIMWRTSAGISLEKISQLTKINPYYLEAIECGEFDKLPAGVYTESYIRQYAQIIGDTSNLLLGYYRTQTSQKQ